MDASSALVHAVAAHWLLSVDLGEWEAGAAKLHAERLTG